MVKKKAKKTAAKKIAGKKTTAKAKTVAKTKAEHGAELMTPDLVGEPYTAKTVAKKAPVKQSTNTTPAETMERVSSRAAKKGREAVAALKLERHTVEYGPTSLFTPNAYNPNRQSDTEFEMLLKSMVRYGFTLPIFVNDDMTIVDGEHRWRAACVLDLKEIPFIRTDLSAGDMRIATITHNRARGSHDIGLEAEMLRDFEKLGMKSEALDSLMMSETEYDKIVKDTPVPEFLAAAEFSEAWEPQAGFTDEENDLISSGNLSEEATVKTMPDGSTVVVGMTADAIETQRKRAKLIERAKTERDRAKIRKESQVYRVSLVFSGKEADVVKSVLGKTPAKVLLELCQEAAK